MLQVAGPALCQREVRAVIAEPEARVPGVASVDAAVPRRSRSTSRACSSASPRSTRARWRRTSRSWRPGRPNHFGICIATVGGAVYETGDARVDFTIQSMSKPLTYGLALERLGREAVHRRVGVEPSGDPFNEISLDPGTGTPVNPMINAGAIVCAGLVAGLDDDPLALLLDAYGRYAGRTSQTDEAVYRSESETGPPKPGDRPPPSRRERPRRGAGSGRRPVLPAVRRLGRLPRPRPHRRDARERRRRTRSAGRARASRRCRARGAGSVMTTCGMYDAAGDWLISVGLPARAACVAGGVFAVLPGRLGIGVYSPALDAKGNSVRGIAVCKALSHDLALHLVRPGERMAPLRSAPSTSSGRSAPSASARPASARRSARRRPARLSSSCRESSASWPAEAISRRIVEAARQPELRRRRPHRLSRVDRGGAGDFSRRSTCRSRRAAARSWSPAPPGRARARSRAARDSTDLDTALEWCEDELLARARPPADTDAVDLAEHELLAGLEPERVRAPQRGAGDPRGRARGDRRAGQSASRRQSSSSSPADASASWRRAQARRVAASAPCPRA